MRHAGPTDEEPQVTDARRTRVTKAVIPAAGLGTRFLPATKSTPKEMLPVVDKPAIQLVVEEAAASGLRDVLMVTGRSKRALEDHFDVAPELERVPRAEGRHRPARRGARQQRPRPRSTTCGRASRSGSGTRCCAPPTTWATHHSL